MSYRRAPGDALKDALPRCLMNKILDDIFQIHITSR